MTIIIPRSATWVIWPCVLALASTLAFALGWSTGVDNGRLTASGAVFDENEFTAASPWIEFGKKIRVTNIANGRSVTVRITDRGPHPRLGRGLDLSTAAAREIGLIRPGVAPVQIGPAW